jgi:hypothetical protein
MNKYAELLQISRNIFNKNNMNKKMMTQKSESSSPPLRKRINTIVLKEPQDNIPLTTLPSLTLK